MKAKDFMTPIRRYRETDEQRAAGLVTTTGISVSEEASIFTCIDCLLKYPISRLPVLDKNKQVVGVLLGQDVFSSVMMIALIGVLVLALWSMRGMITLRDVATLVW